MDDRDPDDGCEIINRGRRRQIWQAITSALECETNATTPPWVMNTPEIGGDLPTGDAMLQVMAEVIGDEVLDRLSDEGREPQDAAAAPTHDHPRRDPLRDVIERLEVKFKDEPDVEFGFLSLHHFPAQARLFVAREDAILNSDHRFWRWLSATFLNTPSSQRPITADPRSPCIRRPADPSAEQGSFSVTVADYARVEPNVIGFEPIVVDNPSRLVPPRIELHMVRAGVSDGKAGPNGGQQ
jgi:hypothetical protein